MVTDPVDEIIQPGGDVTRAMLADTYWLARDGDRLSLIAVDDMTPDHQQRLLAWLRSHAREVHWFARAAVKAQWRRGEITDIEKATRLTLLGAVPELWLEDTALVRRLCLLVARPPRRERTRWLPARLRRTR